MRIVSLLPSATETLWALGLGHQVVGVTHECDHPPEASRLPIVTRPAFRLEDLDGGAVEAQVRSAAAEGRSLYEIDAELIMSLRADIVVSQDVCDVCALPASQAVDALPGVRVLRQHPHSLDDVLDGMLELAAACEEDGRGLVAGLRLRLEEASRRARSRPVIRGVFLEWVDPPYPAGHWTPDLLRLAGIDDPLALPGQPSAAATWEDVRDAGPEVLMVAPCGLDEERAAIETRRLEKEIARVGARHLVVLDGSAYFNRPGPRLADSLEVLVASLERPAEPGG